MKEKVNYKKNNNTIIALGYFDAVHLGHRAILSFADNYKKINNVNFVVFTFEGNLKSALNGKQEKCIYTFSERQEIYYSLGADEVFFAPISREFLDKDKKEFLQLLNAKYNICAYVCGKDYRFGKNGLGNVEYLKEFAKQHNQEIKIFEDVTCNGIKVSSSLIKELLIKGDLEQANKLLSTPYFISGKVVQGRGVGKELGFPTANLQFNLDKQPLKEGVYCGYCIIDNKKYLCIINYGNCPTFDVEDKKIEIHIVDYVGNLYERDVNIHFVKRLRDIKKFSSQQQLQKQIEQDKQNARKCVYD